MSAAAFSKSTTGVQHLVVDLDQLAGVLGEVAVVGDDHRDRLTGEAHIAIGEGRSVAIGISMNIVAASVPLTAGAKSAAVKTACTPFACARRARHRGG